MNEAETQPWTARIRSHAAEFRTTLERELGQDAARREQTHDLLLRLLGAACIGIFAAAFAIFALVVVLNLVFHFSPE
ncbi:hypothetical protein [Paracoccus ravus]|uniref:hypothetical protein n=1 Tax=Paracoccus ravus TaxID=2447760 RepID=UPI00106E13DE|nr:hypothetical protein [Paracoccus ravus]